VAWKHTKNLWLCALKELLSPNPDFSGFFLKLIMPGKAKPAPPGYVTANHVAKESGLHPWSIRNMFNRGDLEGKRETIGSGATKDRILITDASANAFLVEVRRAKRAKRDRRGGYSVREFAAEKGVPAGTIKKACEDGKIPGARKIKFEKGGVGGQWILPNSMGDLDTAGVRALLKSKQKPRVRGDYRKRGQYTPQQLSETLASEGVHISRYTIRRWCADGYLPAASKKNGVSFFSKAQLPLARRIARSTREEREEIRRENEAKPEQKKKTKKIKRKAKIAYVKLRTLRLKATPDDKLLTMEQVVSGASKRGALMSSDTVESLIADGKLDGFVRRDGDGQYLFATDTIDHIVLNLRGKRNRKR